jgi:hypothetical protein
MGHRLRRMGRATRPRPFWKKPTAASCQCWSSAAAEHSRASARAHLKCPVLREVQRKRRSRNEGFKGGTAEPALSLHASRSRPSTEGLRE